jgi:hypothetical protein
MSESADLIRAIAALPWVAVGVAVLVVLSRVVLSRSEPLKAFGVGPTGVTMEFVEAKVDQRGRSCLRPACRAGRKAVCC